jgi:hypothetical protein
MVGERKQAKSEATVQDNTIGLGKRTRHAWDALVAAKLHDERSDVEGVKLKRGEVAYLSIDGVGLVEPRRAEASTVTDTGMFVVTNQRCVFVGSKRKTEWVYSKLVEYSLEGEAVAMFNVSNRQKTTGVKYAVDLEPRIEATITAAIARFHSDAEHAALVNELEQDHRRAYAEWEEAGSHAPPTA